MLKIADYNANQPKQQITIPSVLKTIDALNTVTNFGNDEIFKSWQSLSKYTEQTLFNFNNKKQQGIFLVHSLEDIMGVAECFLSRWNENHPQDLRSFKKPLTGFINSSNIELFYCAFTPTEFITHYIKYILGSRPLIAGSILAFSEHTQHCLTKTFAPLNFIINVPAQCISIAGKLDIGSPVVYLYEPENEHEPDQNEKIQFIQHKLKHSSSELSYDYGSASGINKPYFSLHGLVKFPINKEFIQKSGEESNPKYNLMNEVCFKPYAKDEHGQYEAKIVGALISEDEFDSCINGRIAERHEILLKEPFKNFIDQQKLPCFNIKSTPYIEEVSLQKDQRIEYAKGQTYLFTDQDIIEYGLIGE